jgi:hypothetical protein
MVSGYVCHGWEEEGEAGGWEGIGGDKEKADKALK